MNVWSAVFSYSIAIMVGGGVSIAANDPYFSVLGALYAALGTGFLDNAFLERGHNGI